MSQLPEGAMPLLDHLKDLRKMIIRSLLALTGGMLIAIPFAPQLQELLQGPIYYSNIGDPKDYLMEMNFLGPFDVLFKLSFWAGLLLAIPFILYFIGQFVFPGLHANEKKAVRGGSVVGSILFFLGVALAYRFTMPYLIDVNVAIAEWQNLPYEKVLYGTYIKSTLRLMIAFGLAFELPLLTFVLGWLGVFSAETLRKKRRHIFVGILILAMFLTPPDVVSQVILAVPLYAMFEVAIWLVWLKEKKNRNDSGNLVQS